MSFNDAPDGRRLMIGWASTWSYARDTPTAPWRSAMSLVREVELVRTADGRLGLAQTPVLPAPAARRDQPDAAGAEGGLRRSDVRVPRRAGTRTRLVLSSRLGPDVVDVLQVHGAQQVGLPDPTPRDGCPD